MIPLLNAPIRLLLCKLDPGTAERALFELEHAGMAVDFRSVNSLDEFTACVPGAAYDLIISEDADDTARAFDLIGVTRDLGVDTPVLLITLDMTVLGDGVRTEPGETLVGARVPDA